MFEVRQTAVFRDWLGELPDKLTAERINARIARLELGNFGDAKFFDGIGELRLNFGPGFRIYLARRGNTVVILLCGGDKNTQRRDILRAKVLAKELDNGD